MSHPRTLSACLQLSENDEVAGAMDRMAHELYTDIKQYRYEHDVLIQQKSLYKQRLLELENEMTDLTRTYNGSVRPAVASGPFWAGGQELWESGSQNSPTDV